MSEAEGDRRARLELELMVAETANKRADAALKDEQRRWEPWKAMSAAFGAGVAVATGLIALATWLLSHIIHS